MSICTYIRHRGWLQADLEARVDGCGDVGHLTSGEDQDPDVVPMLRICPVGLIYIITFIVDYRDINTLCVPIIEIKGKKRVLRLIYT
jgi:hypothetical protein